MDGRSTLAQWKRARIAEYVSDLGGESEVSTQQRATIEDIVDSEIVAARARDELYGVKRLYRKGKAHPLLDVWFKAIAQSREGRKCIGFKRVVKTLTLEEMLADE